MGLVRYLQHWSSGTGALCTSPTLCLTPIHTPMGRYLPVGLLSWPPSSTVLPNVSARSREADVRAHPGVVALELLKHELYVFHMIDTKNFSLLDLPMYILVSISTPMTMLDTYSTQN